MAGFAVRVNAQELNIKLANFSAAIAAAPLLSIAGSVMRSSIEQTFREQGSPAGSWPPLAPWTRTGALSRFGYRKGKLTHGRAGGAMLAGKLMLIDSGRLKNSITYTVQGNILLIGSNLAYAAIQQLGGVAGRKPPFKKPGGRRPFIPPRPYLVFRPEDPERMRAGMERYIQQQVGEQGLGPK